MELNLTRKQSELIKALQTRRYRYLMFGGGMGGSKSYLGAIIFLQLALQFPNSRYAVIRKNMSVLKRTTYLTFQKVANDLHIPYTENRQDMYWQVGDSRIYFLEADDSKDQDFNKLRGLELTAAMIDEANEVAEKAFNILKMRIGRENRNGELAFLYLTTNPDQNWVKETFYDPYKEGSIEAPYYYLQALAKDNPFNQPEYIEALEHLPENEYNRFVLGDWSYSDDPNQLIRFDVLKPQLLASRSKEADGMGIDVAREGDDDTFFAYRKNIENVRRIGDIELINSQDTITTASIAIEKMKDRKVGAGSVSVDVIGVGGGVVDSMRSRGYRVNAFNSGASPTEDAGHLQFKNMRAQMYWKLREGLENGTIELVDDARLIKELTAIRYFVKDKYIQIESKPEIKKRLGSSPDMADAVTIALFEPKRVIFSFV